MSKRLPPTNSSAWDAFIERLYRQNEFAIKLGLEAVDAALEREGRPQNGHPAILVGGTNGKGETAAFLSSILTAHGLTVGLFTSPHIVDFRERFRIDGQLLGRTDILALGRRILRRYGVSDTPGPRLTFFELTTVMAVLGFAANQVDVGVYEVGLGGRLDATNALPAQMSVVTSIGLDHKQYLGDTIAEVAGEKAGIFRAERPAVIGRQAHAEAQQTLHTLAPSDASFYGDDFWADDGAIVARSGDLTITWRARLPATRRWNAACAVQAASRFLGEGLDIEATRKGLEQSRWPGRLDLRIIPPAHESTSPQRARRYLFDAAHNPDASKLLFEFIESNTLDIGAVIFGAMSDKDLKSIVSPMPSHLPVFGAALESDRAASAGQLKAVLTEKSLVAVGSTDEMIRRVQSTAAGDTTILVFGSIYLLGECFELLDISVDSLITYVG